MSKRERNGLALVVLFYSINAERNGSAVMVLFYSLNAGVF
jgi:hypothetical protein